MNEGTAFFKALSAWQHTPDGGIKGLATVANGKIQRRLAETAAVADCRDGFAGLHPAADLAQQALVMSVQAEITVAMDQDEQQPRAAQPVGKDHPAPMHRLHPRPRSGCDQQAIPLQPPIAATLAAETRAYRAAYRQRQLAPGLGKRHAAGRGRNAGDGLVELLDECGQLRPLRLPAPDFLLLIAAALAQAGQRGAALFPLGLQRAAALRQGLAVALQHALLLGDLLAGLADLFDGQGVAVDLLHPGLVESAVVAHHARHSRRIVLVEQHLQVVLTASHVGRPYLTGDLFLLGLQRVLQRRSLLLQRLQSRFAFADLPFDIRRFAAQPADLALAVPQLPLQDRKSVV